ncbi:hypothetical protein JR316_0009251 [Psilocybe cubensis]|uniref:Uncharacterized protein n=2 Tax=Psilocybe cubensis TaxID=181762 RepID=A0A8H7XVF6_PSICU|nr:hypothetical protein JR316_0009251 [Psilocybe cubensis]KAH9478790.1 hypothetical protein JR316_0009251 [Psilocybe cubensis]
MVKFTSVFFVAAVVVNAVPTLARQVFFSFRDNRRSLESDDIVLSRDVIEAVYGRELTDVELQERAPFFPLIFAALRIGAQVGARVGSRVASKVGRKAAHKAAEHHQQNHNNNHHHKRSLETSDIWNDLLEREEFFDEAFERRDINELD